MRTRILIVDGSFTIRALLAMLLEADERFTVVGVAAGTEEARMLMRRRLPDVVTLDIEMPGANGIDFLAELATDDMVPVVIVSAHTPRGAPLRKEMLALGAAACFDKACLLRDAKRFVNLLAHAAHRERKHGRRPGIAPAPRPATQPI